MFTLQISDEHKQALDVIVSQDKHYKKIGFSRTVEELIEDYLVRENGKLGEVINGRYCQAFIENYLLNEDVIYCGVLSFGCGK